MQGTSTYKHGDWIVHKNYGVGQIRGIEQKSISGSTNKYYRIHSDNSTFWVPIDALDENLRPLISKSECQKIVQVFEKPPRKMHNNFRKRQSRIRAVEKGDSLLEIARLIRDLVARSTHTNLNSTERNALRDLKRRFLAEWRTSLGYNEREAQHRLNALLNFGDEPVAYRQN